MEFVIDKKRLDSVVNLLANYVEKRDAASANASLAIAGKDGELILRASDGEMGICYHIRECQIAQEGEIFINAKKLSDILKSLENTDIKISAKEDKIKITQKKTRFNLQQISSGEFIFMNEQTPRVPLALNAAMLSAGLRIINNSIDSNSISLQFNCAHIKLESSEISFAGSDSKIVSIYRFCGQFGAEDKVILSKRAVGEILKLLAEEVRVYKNQDFFIIENDNFTFFSRVVNIDLLPYRQVMPKINPNAMIKLPTAQISAEVKKLSAVGDKCLLQINPDGVVFKDAPIEDEQTSARSEIACETNVTQSIEVYLNVKYLQDFLNNSGETFELRFYSPGAPVVLVSGDFMALIACVKS